MEMLILYFIEFWLRILPVPVSMWIGRRLGSLFYGVAFKHRRIAIQNLRQAFPEYPLFQIKKIAHKAFQHLVLVGIEIIILSRKSVPGFRDRICDHGLANLEKAKACGKSILFLTGHVGNWELLAFLGRWAKFIESVIARDVKGKAAQRLIQSIRSRYDVHVVSKGEIRYIIQEFEEGRTVGALIDQDGGRRGTFVPFFGRPASTPTGVIRLALKAGLPILPAFLRRVSDRLEFRSFIGEDLTEGLDALSLEEKEKIVLERFTHSLELFIREDPGQWLWLHRRWKTRPEGEFEKVRKNVLLLNDGKAGHFNQILGIKKGLEGWESNVCEVRYRSKFHRWVLYGMVFLRIASMRVLRYTLTRGSIKQLPGWTPSLILACGSLSAPVAYILKRYYGSKTVILMRSALPAVEKLFDLAILPIHDHPPEAPNVLKLVGMPTTINEEWIKIRGNELSEKLVLKNEKILGILIGGHSNRLSMEPQTIKELCYALHDFCEKNSFHILLATSRRTPSEVDQVIQDVLGGKKNAHLLWAKDYPDNPIPGILGLSEYVIVTEDSFSMLMEAVHSGKPVLSVRLKANSSKPLKYEETLNALEKENRIFRTLSGEAGGKIERLFRGQLHHFKISNLETAKAVQAIKFLMKVRS